MDETVRNVWAGGRQEGREGGDEIDAEVAVCLLILPVVVLDVTKQALPSSAAG